MQKIVLGVLMLGQIVAAVGCATSDENTKQMAELHLKIGSAHLNNGLYPEALAELLKAEALDSKNPLVQNNLGLAYLVRGKLDLAEEHLQKSVDLNPKFTDARNNLGRVQVERGNLRAAIQNLQTAVDDLTFTMPEKSFTNLGLAFFKNQEFGKAKESFRKALGYKKRDCFALLYYGRSLYELKQYGLASKGLDQAIQSCKLVGAAANATGIAAINPERDESSYYSALS